MLLTVPKSLIKFSINMVTILMMSAKIATPGFLKIKAFWNKGYGILNLVDDVTYKILSRN